MEAIISTSYSFKIRLTDAINGGFKLTPTLAAGDFKISTASIAAGAPTNLTDLPTEVPAGSGIVVVTLTAAEMADGDPMVLWKDQTDPQEWIEGYAYIDTRPSLAAIKAKTDNLPSDPADASVIAGRFDTLDITAAAILATTDNLATAIEIDGGVYRFTTNALEQAPSGGAIPSADDIANEVETRALLLHADYDAAKTAASQGSVNSMALNVGNLLARVPNTLTLEGLMQVDVIRIDGDDNSVWKESP